MTRLWLSPEEAAPVLGMKPAKIRNYMRRGILDLGLAIPPEKTGKTMWEFRIYPAKNRKDNRRETGASRGRRETGMNRNREPGRLDWALIIVLLLLMTVAYMCKCWQVDQLVRML